MKEKDNIEEINQELKGYSKLQSLKGKQQFKVPDSYFDNLEDNIMSKIVNEAAPVQKIHMNVKQVLYYVAAASIIAFFVFIALRSGNQDTNKTPIAIQPTKTINSQNSITNNEENSIEKNNSENRTNESIKKVEKLDQNTIAIEEKNNAIDKVSNVNQSLEQNRNQKKTNIDIENDNSSDYDLANNNQHLDNSSLSENIGGQVIAGGTNGSQSSNYSPSLARKTVQNNLYLGDDRCSNKPIQLSAKIDDMENLRYRWSTDDTSVAILAKQSGNYWVKVYDIKNNLLGSDTVNVKILNKPNPNLGADRSICNYESILISSGINNTDFEYQWSIKDATTPEIYLSDMNPGVYNITLWVKSCADTVSSSMTLTVNDCNIKIPNVITPNGDSRNDRFVITGLENYPGSQLYILDRNGQIVFESMDYQNDWDANNIQTGTYFYRLQLNDGKKSEKNGTLSIIR